MTTYCSSCDRVHPDTRKDAPWRWRCMAAPVESTGYGFVTPDYAPSPPYDLCFKRNEYGECDDFVSRRVPPKKETPAKAA